MSTAMADSLETTTETVTKTIICQLETSQRKNERVQSVIDEWQAVAARMAELMPSIDADHWRAQDSTIHHVVKNEFPEYYQGESGQLRAHDVDQAASKVAEAFGSWDSNGRPSDDNPKGRFGDGQYARFSHDISGTPLIYPNHRGFGLKATLRSYQPEWFHIDAGLYQREYLKRIASEDHDLKPGTYELHLSDDGSLACHLAVKRDVNVYAADDLDRWVGVCLGEKTVYAAVVAGADGKIEAVEMKAGGEFRHHRNRFERKREQLMEQSDLRRLLHLRDEHRRYTDYTTHAVAREIVDFALDHDPCGIRLEDMTHLRETAADPIHDFPFDEVQTKIAYKATEEGIPVEFVPPHHSKVTCRQCGEVAEESRDGPHFGCVACGYQVHSFVNGAANIGTEAHRDD